jgi:hypothetical protein
MKPDLDDERRAALCEWATANGLDPDRIDEHIEVVRGKEIRYRELVDVRDGAPVWEDRKAPLSVPLPSLLA